MIVCVCSAMPLSCPDGLLESGGVHTHNTHTHSLTFAGLWDEMRASGVPLTSKAAVACALAAALDLRDWDRVDRLMEVLLDDALFQVKNACVCLSCVCVCVVCVCCVYV